MQGVGALGGGFPPAIPGHTGRSMGKTPVLAWMYVGQGVDSALTMRLLTIVHRGSSLPCDSCSCLYGRP